MGTIMAIRAPLELIITTITCSQASKEEVEVHSAEQRGEDTGAGLHLHRRTLRLLLHTYGRPGHPGLDHAWDQT